MCIISKERIALCAPVEGTRGEIFTASPIALQSRCKRVRSGGATPPERNILLLMDHLTVYNLDDILIYLIDTEEHKAQVQKVLEAH